MGKRDRGAFTLLELLAVMAIMMLLMGITVGSYYGFVQGASIEGAAMSLRGTLMTAREFAMTHRTRTHVFFWQDTTNAHYVAVAEQGSQAGSGGGALLTIDLMFSAPWPSGQFVGNDIYNITRGISGVVLMNSANQLQASNNMSPNAGLMAWNYGDKYGWPISAQVHVPNGVMFCQDGSAANVGKPWNAPGQLTFNADGTSPIFNPSPYVIRLWEVNPPSAAKHVEISSLSGKVKVVDPP